MHPNKKKKKKKKLVLLIKLSQQNNNIKVWFNINGLKLNLTYLVG